MLYASLGSIFEICDPGGGRGRLWVVPARAGLEGSDLAQAVFDEKAVVVRAIGKHHKHHVAIK